VDPDAAVHSIPTLIIPDGLAGSSQFVEEGSDVRACWVRERPRPCHGSPTACQPRQGGRCCLLTVASRSERLWFQVWGEVREHPTAEQLWELASNALALSAPES